MDFESANDLLKSVGCDPVPVFPATACKALGKTEAELVKELGAESCDSTVPDSSMFDDFYGAKNPAYINVKEQPKHRLAVLLKAKGMSNREIAGHLEMSPVTVGYVLRQPWARERLAKVINEAGGDMIREVLASAAIDTVHKLIDLRDNEKVPPAVQKAACTDLLDRFLGKPTQQLEVRHDSSNLGGKDIKALDVEINALNQEVNRLTLNAQ